MHDPIQDLGPRRQSLVDRSGRTYVQVRRGLRPRYAAVWLQIAVGYGALLGVAWGLGLAAGISPWLAWGLAPAAAIAFGYGVAFLHLFLHEAVHHHLARPRRWNDRLANLAVGLLTATDVRRYRPIHFEHHRRLGTPEDTEHTYFEPLGLRFVLESLTGIRVLRTVRERARASGDPGAGPGFLAGVLLFHAAALAGVAALGGWPAVVAWLAGLGAVFPFLASLRQLLEHRRLDARPEADYRREPHGATSRLFGAGPFASTFGGAGFNRHLLHHWDPQVPCTRLAELEAFLMETEAGPWLDAHRTTYGRALRDLARSA